LFEYMAAGCAIVASDLPSIREILAEDDAIWFRAGDSHSLAAGLRRLSSDPELARTLAARVHAKASQYTWIARADKLCGVLHISPVPT
jgi:glycosyltransferase involved in cell wall biosynthesis